VPKIKYAGDEIAQYTDAALFEARLKRDGEPVKGAEVAFILKDGGEKTTYRATTDRDGTATTTEIIDEAAGRYRLVARYKAGGDTVRDKTGFVIEHEDSALELTVEDHSSGEGDDETADRLAAILDQVDGDGGIGGRTITFYADGELIGSATTDGGGFASIEVPAEYRNGEATFEARFAGDDYFLSAADVEG